MKKIKNKNSSGSLIFASKSLRNVLTNYKKKQEQKKIKEIQNN